MDVRAAVAYAPGKPLEVTTVQLDGPRSGEVLVEIKATGICHTDEFTLSGADPEGSVSGHPRPRRRRHRRRCRSRRHLGEKGRSRHSAVHAGMPQLPVVPVAQDQSVHRHPRHPGPGRDAGRHLAVFHRRQEDPSLYGLLDLRQFHRAAGDRGGENPRRRAVRQGLLYRLRRHHRHRRGDQHRQGRAGRQSHRVRSRRHRAQRHSGPAARRRRHDHRRRSQPGKESLGRTLRHDAFRQSEGGRAAISSRIWSI